MKFAKFLLIQFINQLQCTVPSRGIVAKSMGNGHRVTIPGPRGKKPLQGEFRSSIIAYQFLINLNSSTYSSTMFSNTKLLPAFCEPSRFNRPQQFDVIEVIHIEYFCPLRHMHLEVCNEL